MLKRPNLLVGVAGAILQQPNLTAMRNSEATSHDWGKVVVGRCWRHFEVTGLGLSRD